MCRHQPEPTEEGDWRDAWRAPRRTRKTSQPEPLARHDNESEIDPSRSAAGERLQTGMDRSLPVIMSSPPHQPRPQLVRKPYYSPSWPTWRANPTTSSTGPRSAPRCLGIRKLGVRDAANLDGRRDVPYLFVAPTQDPRFPAMPTSFIHPYVTPQTPGPVSGDRPGQYTSGLARISEPWKFSVKPLEDHQRFDRPPSTSFIPPPIYVSQSSRRTSLLTSEGALSRAPRLLHHQVVPGTPSGWGPAHDARKSLEPDLQERRARYPSGELRVPALIYPAPSSNSIPAVTLPERPDHQALYDTTAAFHFGRPPAMAFAVADNASPSPHASTPHQNLPTYSQTRASQQDVHWTPTRARNEALALVHAAANLNEEPARLSGVEDVLVQLAQHLPSSSHRSGPSARSRSEPPIPFGSSALAPTTLSQDDQELPPSQHRNSPKLEPGWIAYGPQTPQQQIPFGLRGRCGAYATPAEPATGVSSGRDAHVGDAEFSAVTDQVPKILYPNSASRRSTSTFARSRRTDPTHFCSSSNPDPLLLRSDQVAEQELWQYGTTKQDWGKLWSDARAERPLTPARASLSSPAIYLSTLLDFLPSRLTRGNLEQSTAYILTRTT